MALMKKRCCVRQKASESSAFWCSVRVLPSTGFGSVQQSRSEALMEARRGVAVTMGCLQALVSAARLTQPNEIRCAHVIIACMRSMVPSKWSRPPAHAMPSLPFPAPPCRRHPAHATRRRATHGHSHASSPGHSRASPEDTRPVV